MSTVAGMISFKSKPGQGAEAARLIAEALPHVQAEQGTPLWLVLRSSSDPDSVFLVDLFSDAAAQIFATLPALLAEDPQIHPAAVVARKGA